MFGYTLKSLRKEHKLTQEDLGIILNLSQQTISQYEKSIRFPDEAIINFIADYFEVSTDYLFGRTTIKNIYKSTE